MKNRYIICKKRFFLRHIVNGKTKITKFTKSEKCILERSKQLTVTSINGVNKMTFSKRVFQKYFFSEKELLNKKLKKLKNEINTIK